MQSAGKRAGADAVETASDTAARTAAQTATIRILVNGESREVPQGCSIERLIALLELTDKRVAVARNRDVVPRSTYADVALTDGDHIEILEAVGGG